MDKLKNIKGVFLDLGGTLLYPPSGNWLFSQLARRYFPQEITETAQGRAVITEAHRELERDHLTLSIEKELEKFGQFYADAARGLGLSLTPEELRMVTEDKVLNKKDNYRLFDDTAATLQALHGKVKLGIISDTWPSIVPVLEYFGILGFFDFATYSYELGVLKPDPAMYTDALFKMGLPAGETLFVDDRACNLEAAWEAGIHPVLIQAVSPLPDWEQFVPEGAPVIQKISGLLDILEKEES